jgi:choline dehydrogenase-like flavoprotein
MTTQTLPSDSANGYDYLIVGGGTAGCVVASRLSAYLPKKRILLIEGGPSDVGDDRVLVLKDRIQTIGTDLDYGYTSVPQPNGWYPHEINLATHDGDWLTRVCGN